MKTLNLIQGTPEWHAHRAACFNASDAPAMMGVSPYKTRTQLIRERATGIVPEIDSATQKRFDDGHKFEALARPLAEAIIGDDLFPCTGVSDDGLYSASFDGLTLLGDCVFEHKSLNNDLRDVMVDESADENLAEHYRIQMEQQCMVSGADRALFMASKWSGDDLVEERRCWYYPNPELRARIVAGWKQFGADVADYVREPVSAPAATGHAPDQLPALRIELTGMVTESNLVEFKDRAIAVFQSIRTDLTTDQDFADAEQTVKFCKDIEDRLKAAKQHALSQTASIDDLFRAIDQISAEARDKRLELDKLVKSRKEDIRAEIVQRGFDLVGQHYRTINSTLGEHALTAPTSLRSDLAAAIKGRKTVASLNDAVDSAIADAKIEASQTAERIRANISVLSEVSHESLFADRRQLVATKEPEDLRNLVKARIAEDEQREAKRLEQERERIRKEEVDKLEREQAAAELAKAKQDPKGAELSPPAQALNEAEGAKRFVEHHPAVPKTVPAGARIKLAAINDWIAPLLISAEGLASLGFKPTASKGAAETYSADDLPHICGAIARLMADVIARAASKKAA